MKRFLSSVLSVIMILSLMTACAEKEEEIFVEDDVKTDPTLIESCDKFGFDPEDLMCDQLILVRSNGSEAAVDCYERVNGAFVAVSELAGMSGYVGKNGVTKEKVEGDGCSPEGVFPLSFAFGVNEKPDTKLEYRQVNENCYWVDDVDSPLYNTYVETGDTSSFNSAEHLIDYPVQYAYAVVIEYNTDPIVTGNGSGIFLHCSAERPTAGCVSVPEEDMLKILKWLDPEKAPGIIIC